MRFCQTKCGGIMSNYEARLICSILGNDNYPLLTYPSHTKLAFGYNRIVIGDRGPYVEFFEDDFLPESFYIPHDQRWRRTSSNAYYLEYRTFSDDLKVYGQVKPVGYADYIPGRFYISPFFLCNAEGTLLITRLPRGRKKILDVPLIL